MSRLLLRAGGLLGLGLGLVACPSRPKEVVYDLAARSTVAERWAAADVLLFGTPAAEPRLVDGFHREGAGGGAEPFLWSKEEAEVVYHWDEPASRLAILDAAPYREVPEQSVEVRLNGTVAARLRMGDIRQRYRIPLPAEAQQAGENRLRLVFAGSASPSDVDPTNNDRRRLAAALYSLVTGPASDASLEDLLARDAPRPFAVREDSGLPRLHVVGPAVLRFTVRLPEAAELRFTPALEPAARSSAGSATFHVAWERVGEPEETLWTRVLDGATAELEEQVVRLPGRPGEIVRVGLAVGVANAPRFAWGQFVAPRILGRGEGDALEPQPFAPDENARADPMRRALEGTSVVLVILDAARAAQLGAYGYARSTTPEIDRLAAEGVVFERAYTPAVYTLAAMSSLWTSQYPDRHHGEVAFSARLPSDRLTLAELLSRGGIHAVGFTANAMSGPAFGLDRGFAEFHELFRTLGTRGDVFRQVLPRWLALNRDRRFFAYLHFREPHFPYDPRPPFDTKFGPDGPLPKAARTDWQFFRDVNQGRRPLSEAEQEHLVRLYDGSLAFADQEVGALRAALEAEGLWERTVFIVAADHGEELYEHGFVGHNVYVFEPSVHIPLVVRFPASVGISPRRVGALVDLLDLGATIADIFGVLGQGDSDREFHGRSLLPVIAGAPGKPAILSRTVWERPRYGLRDERYKFLYDSRTGEGRLHDLDQDPEESRNIVAAQPLRASYYRQALHHWLLRLRPDRRSEGETATLTSEQCENLKALGYVVDCP